MTPSALTRDRLRVAIQRSGRLAEPARDLLASCGLTWRESRDKLFCYGESLPVDLLLVRDGASGTGADRLVRTIV